jgi:hypothetical protein
MKKGLISTLILAAAAYPLFGQMTVSLTANASRIPLGTSIRFSALAAQSDGSTPPKLWYRYRVRSLGENYRMIRDFGPNTDLQWAESSHEGTYVMEVTALNVATGEKAVEHWIFYIDPLATTGPVITPTSHPLVFIYSTPGCDSGSSMRVEIQDRLGNLESTSAQACQSGMTTNLYVGGMQPNAAYQVHQRVYTGPTFADGPPMPVTAGTLPVKLAPYTVVQAPPAVTVQPVLLQSTLSEPAVATDLSGNILWYYPYNDLSYITRPEPGGRFLGVYENSTKDPSYQIVREFDLAGNTIQETNAARVNQQLQAMNKRTINSFHHEALRMPNGNLMVLAGMEQILTDVQGPGPVDVIGDMIIVLDRDLQVVWAWDSFDHLDTSRKATLNETCSPTSGGCPPVYLAKVANDWLHGNALQFTADGNILYSMRHQDWIIKIDYNNGTGTGNIVWKLGLGGDFTIVSSDPYPWFSHQHNPNFETRDTSLLDLFDNGDVRYAQSSSAHSRGQVLKIDEQNRVATPILNLDLGAYSGALGSAERLDDLNYHFDLGTINTAQGPASQSVESDAMGNVLYRIQSPTMVYRSFRLSSLYAQ